MAVWPLLITAALRKSVARNTKCSLGFSLLLYLSDICWRHMLERPSSNYAILGMLSLQPMSGYDIRKTVQVSIQHFWSESYGQIYPALKQLETQRLVRRAPGKQEGRSGRQVYALTPAGRRNLRAWLVREPRVRPFRNELLLKLFFGQLVSREACVEHLRQFRKRQTELLRTYRRVEKWLRSEHKKHTDLPFWLITLSYGLHEAQALKAWSDETLAVLGDGATELSRRKRR